MIKWELTNEITLHEFQFPGQSLINEYSDEFGNQIKQIGMNIYRVEDDGYMSYLCKEMDGLPKIYKQINNEGVL